ncbi:SusC/RagA family TonB-linked outer membrane protein [Sphingobacterium multivorum]|uniref:SusC/RagA family TonB-linked outer membrane protein n=1 Tax=Sphingobacterium multivorum TaxID=28454 RepID=UPI003DA4399A
MTHFFRAGMLLPILKKTCIYSTLLSILCLVSMFSLSAQTPRKDSGANGPTDFILQGTVISSIDGRPLQGVSVSIGAQDLRVSSKGDGSFNLRVKRPKGKVKFTYVGYKPLETEYSATVSLMIRMLPLENQLEEVEVVSTGYQQIPKERATGSFELINREKFNINKSTNILSRLEGLSPSFIFDKRSTASTLMQQMRLRGRTTFYGKASPLIVLDNFPYEGDIMNINPNDIESVTILKDAAAASIWGSMAGNGVIVLTTKKGATKGTTKVDANINLQMTEKPDLFYRPDASSRSFIEMEEFLFDKGFYDWQLNAPERTLSPIVQLRDQLKRNIIDQDTYDSQKVVFSAQDVRKDYLKYIYRKGFNQQYNVNFSGGNRLMDFVASGGYNKSLNSLKSSFNDRYNVRAAINARPTDRLQLNLSTVMSRSSARNLGSESSIAYGALYSGDGRSNYPYISLVDDGGNFRNLETVTFKSSFIDTLFNGQLLPAKYNLGNELQSSENVNTTTDIMLNLGGQFKINEYLQLMLNYQYQESTNKVTNWQGLQSYFTQNYINLFSQYSPTAGLKHIIPIGDIYTMQDGRVHANNLRVNAQFDKSFGKGDLFRISGILGAELKDLQNRIDGSRLYGYDRKTLNYQPVDFLSTFPLLGGLAGSGVIPNGIMLEEYRQRFLSVFSNASLTYKNRYVLSASARQDASNLFGVSTNDKWQPLWSSGLSWDISQEPFYKISFLPYLKLRMTYGYNGKAVNDYSAYPTMEYGGTNSITGLPFGYMVNPPNPTYRAERVGILNFGIDLASRNQRISGGIDLYHKEGKDIVARANVDPTVGFDNQVLNVASFVSRGLEASIRSVNIKTRDFQWSTDWIINFNRNFTKKYNYRATSVSSYMDNGIVPNPIVGNDLYAIYAYRFAGLDPETGAPQGYLNGEVSKDYSKLTSVSIEDVRFMGSAIPLYNGFLRNTVQIADFKLSFTLQYKFKFFFRRTGMSALAFANYWISNEDYDRRWQKPGDERTTNVPAFIYPLNLAMENFYKASDALVERGDAVKLKDINLEYNLKGKIPGVRQASLFLNADNIGLMLWKKTKYRIDSDYGTAIPLPAIYTLGLNISL